MRCRSFLRSRIDLLPASATHAGCALAQKQAGRLRSQRCGLRCRSFLRSRVDLLPASATHAGCALAQKQAGRLRSQLRLEVPVISALPRRLAASERYSCRMCPGAEAGGTPALPAVLRAEVRCGLRCGLRCRSFLAVSLRCRSFLAVISGWLSLDRFDGMKHQGSQSGGVKRRLPSFDRGRSEPSKSSRSQSWQVTCLCIWSSPSQ